METEARSNIANPSATVGDTTATTTMESTNITTAEQTTDQRRGDILPIVYDVQSIPTIGSGGSAQIIRGGAGRQRPFISSKLILKKMKYDNVLFDLNFFSFSYSSSMASTRQ